MWRVEKLVTGQGWKLCRVYDNRQDAEDFHHELCSDGVCARLRFDPYTR